MKLTTHSASASLCPRDRLYQAALQDGTIDLFAGISLLLIGLGWLADLVALSAAIPALTVPLWVAVRRRWIEPRLGYLQFDSSRRRQLRSGQLALVALGTVACALAVTGALGPGPGAAGDWLDPVIPGLPALLVGVGGLVAGALFQLGRLSLYGAAAVLIAVGGAPLQLEPGWLLLATGALPFLLGGILLLRFLRTFPILSNELE